MLAEASKDARLRAEKVLESAGGGIIARLRSADMGVINQDAASVYRYMNFDQIEEYAQVAKEVAV